MTTSTHLTEEDVHAAAWALIQDGAAPTGDGIRRHLGRGSKTTIHKYLQTFWLALADRAHPQTPEMPTAIAEMATQLWERTATEARNTAEAALARQKEQLAAQELAARDAMAEADRRVAESRGLREEAQAARDEALLALDGTRSQLQQRKEAFAALQQRIAVLERDLAAAKQSADDAKASVAALERAHAQSTAEIKAAHTDELQRLGEAHAQSEAALLRQIDRERQDHAAERGALAGRIGEMEKALASTREAQLASAVANARVATEGDLARKRVAELEGTERTLRAELVVAQAAADTLKRRAQLRAHWIDPQHLAAALAQVQKARTAKGRITTKELLAALATIHTETTDEDIP